ncbi:MAG TPA: class I SAM-dependent rRNA methyltransferase [Planctomycetes bacterium]|nr:class I SAM-dependent rRNA methyltransferase [Planctomycetota bacterium]
MTVIDLEKRASRLARRGHPWLYRDDLKSSPLADGTLVRVRDSDGRDLGLACASSRSRVALRLCGPWPGDEAPTAAEFLADRLEVAIGARSWARPEEGVRLVHGEADLLPGLVVDRYADVIVLQTSTALMEHNIELLGAILAEGCSARMVLARNDISVRRHEELPEEVRLLAGEAVDEVVIVEGGVRYTVRPYEGHKTGFYLDQRPARQRIRSFVDGARVLDLFCYQGGFSLAALAAGAREVTAVDQSAVLLERACTDARAQGFDEPKVIAGNAFDVVRDLRRQGENYDLVILDPPAFCKSRREIEGGKRGYRDLNRIAMRLLAPGGRLVTCSCSHHLSAPLFEEVLRQAALDLPFRIVIEERLGAGPDHPALLRLPESEYLKVRILRRWD